MCTLPTGQTQEEADNNSRLIKVALLRGSSKFNNNDPLVIYDWFDLMKLSVKNNDN